MNGPETLYAELTSGRPGAVDDVATELRASVLGLAGVRQHIVTASDVPDWESPSARTQFNMRAWATEAMAQVAQVRCDRAKLAVERAAADYRWVDEQATRVIRWWRRERDRATDALTIVHLREEAMRLLGELRTDYGTALDEARDIFESADLSDWQERWMENGLARMMRFDLEDPTDVGPPIPDSLLTGDDDGGFASQGLGFDPRTGDVLQTSYNKDGQAVLSVIDPGTGEVLRTVDLAAAPGSTAPDHAGGVSVDGDRVYVSSSGDPAQIYEYSLKDIRDAAPGDPVDVQRPPQEVGGGAYHTISNGTLYVGTHNPDGLGEVYTYTRNEDTGKWENEQGPYEAPPKAQGVAVQNGVMYFSSSLGRGNDSTLYAYDMTTGEQLGTERLPNMVEGVVPTTHGLMVTYESGSSMYDDTGGLVPPQDMWPATSMTVTPYSELGVDGGIDVEPPTLQEASVRFGEADASLTRIEGEVDAVDLPADALGDVPQAATFSQGLTTHLDTTARWLRNGHLSAELTTEGLVQAAEDYVKTDDGVRGLFDNGRRFLQQLG